MARSLQTLFASCMLGFVAFSATASHREPETLFYKGFTFPNINPIASN